MTLIQADPGMTQVLASVLNETTVPLTELGHSLEPNERDAGGWFYED